MGPALALSLQQRLLRHSNGLFLSGDPDEYAHFPADSLLEEQGEVRLEEVSGQIAHDALIEQIMNIAPVGKNLIKVTDCNACVPCFMKPKRCAALQCAINGHVC